MGNTQSDIRGGPLPTNEVARSLLMQAAQEWHGMQVELARLREMAAGLSCRAGDLALRCSLFVDELSGTGADQGPGHVESASAPMTIVQPRCVCGATDISTLGYCMTCGRYLVEHDQEMAS